MCMNNAYYNGRFSSVDEVKIPLTDRAVFFGDGVYDAMIGERGRIYLEDEHLARLYENADAIGLTVPKTKKALSEIIRRVIAECDFPYFIYIQLSRRAPMRKHACTDCEPANLLITATPFELPSPRKRLSLTFSDDVRYKMCNIKTLNLLPAVLASTRAESLGYDETVFVRDGFITECAHSNIAIIKNDTLITLPNSPLILPGITKAWLIKRAKTLGIPVLERLFTKEELITSNSVLVTSTSKLILEAESIDGLPLKCGENATAKRLIDTAFSEYWNYVEN